MNNNYLALTALAGLIFTGQALAIEMVAAKVTTPLTAKVTTPYVAAAPLLNPCSSVTVDPPTYVVLGKSTVVKLAMPARRMVVGGSSGGAGRAGRPAETKDKNAPPAAPAAGNNDGVADLDLILLSPTELFFLGKKTGSMNVVLQGADGRCTVKDLIVTIDPAPLQAQLSELMPEETGVKVKAAENAQRVAQSRLGELSARQSQEFASIRVHLRLRLFSAVRRYGALTLGPSHPTICTL